LSNCRALAETRWQLTEELESGRRRFSALHRSGVRNADEVRDDLQRYVIERLGDVVGVLIVDETGSLKTGTKSVGVKR
jgi:hypothetical protein